MSIEFVNQFFRLLSSMVRSAKKYNLRGIPGVGIICAFISVIFWSAAGLCVKMADDVHALEVLTIGAFIQTLIYLSVILYQRNDFFGQNNERMFLFLRCTLGTVSLACLYSSHRLISLSDGMTLRFTAPIFVSLFAYIWLSEPFGRMECLSAGFTIAGVALVGRPTFLFDSQEVMTFDTKFGLALAFCSALSVAISMTVMRRIQKTSSAVVIFWFSMSTLVLGLTALWILDEYKWPSNGTVWVMIILSGLTLAVDQLFITLALKLENAGPIALVQALNVVISFIFSVTILDEKIRLTSFIGGALIFTSIVIMGVYKWCHDIPSSPKPTQDHIIRPTVPSDIYFEHCFQFNDNKRQTIIKI